MVVLLFLLLLVLCISNSDKIKRDRKNLMN
jgi:hypothetical protein